MRWLGALLVLVSLTAVGFDWARRLSGRSRQIRQLSTALQMLEAEVMYGHTPLPVISRKLEQTLESPLSRIFATFAHVLETESTDVKEAWDRSIEWHWSSTALRHKEKEALFQFGQTLGRHGREEQRKYIQLTLAHLRSEEFEAIEDQRKYEKMAKSLGFLGGLLAIIVMI
ncbi:stage III sporulation protein SpoIIIAB [Salicibibacter kimchii]|uniref:Stage III sporulation protein SpoAB n=1 Tax=Salicibibacter kimchii TaxID=2099786 RepID=A0A345BV02_9BACI|nr:stage III sporulation protein SpoIIIAB [Salicibibacter kimchii]AXF54783.1 stage III sporulation protein SpoAB [Salicibibacter kimchii]